MSLEYFVVELSENLAADENAVKSIAAGFKLDERKARLLLSKAPGPVTKPIVRGEAELIARHFRDAGAKVLVRKVSNATNEESTAADTPQSEFSTQANERRAASAVSIDSRNLLKDTGDWLSSSRLEENREQISRRIFFSGLLTVFGIVGLGLYLYLINIHQPSFSFGNAQLWQQYSVLIAASFLALIVGLPLLITNLNQYYSADLR